MVVVLALWLAFLVLVACYLYPIFGPGWMWLAASGAFGLAVPLGIAIWMVRPLSGFKRAAWFTGAFAAVPLLAVAGLSAGAPGHTANALRKHGPLLFTSIFGAPTRSVLSRTGGDATESWANLLQAAPGSRRPPPPRPAHRIAQKRPKPRRALFYQGKRRPRARPPSSPLGRASVVPFVQRGGGWLVRANLSARKRARLRLQLDTGATLSAITNEAAKRLGIKKPTDPVTVDLDTASGRRTFPLVILDRLRLGRAELRHVTVAICDDCANPGLSGLLGLNYARHFKVTLDQRHHRLTLQPYRGPRNRIEDVEPFLRVQDVSGDITGTQVSLRGRIRNRSPRTVHQLRILVSLLDSNDRVLKKQRTEIKKIPPRGVAPFQVETSGQTAITRYRIALLHARW